MSAKEVKALTRRLFEEWNKGKAAALSEIDKSCATNVVFHSGQGRDIRGLKDFKQYFSELFSAFPDIHFTIEDMVVEGDKVAVRYTNTGTHKGEFMGIPPTNKKVTNELIQISHMVDGKIVEGWLKFDTLNLMQQLGVVPMPGKGK